MTKLRFVIDTNTLVSSILIATSVPNLALQAIRKSGAILISTETLAELKTLMNRKKFEKYVTKEIRS